MTNRLSMTSKGLGAFEVILDGQDVSNALRGLTLYARAGEMATAELEVVTAVVEKIDAPVKLWVAKDSRELLIRFGWTPPAEAEEA